MSDTESLLPVYQKNGNEIIKMLKKNKHWSLEISFFKLGWFSLSCCLFSFVFCVIWSILYNFEEANATHCAVKNYLPSISAAIGHFYPQIYIWNVTVLLQMITRLKISTMYLHYYNTVIFDNYSKLYKLVWFLSIWELWSLLGLSFITSTTNYTLHAFCFICFLFSSILHMILTCYLLKYRRKVPAGNLESKTLKWKFKCCLFNIFCFLMAGYFFKRHNSYCEPLVYSIFALFEYGVVLSNMLFHLFAVWDFHDKTFTFTLTSRGVQISYSPPFKPAQYNLK